MTEETKDQVTEEVDESTEEESTEEKDQSTDEQSEDTKEETTLEGLAKIVEGMQSSYKGLQGGYTQTRQDLSDMRSNLKTIADSLNKKSGAEAGEEEYVTVSKLKDVLIETVKAQTQEQESRIEQANTQIEDALNQLRINGDVKTKEDEDALMKYAIKIKEPNLFKASERWQEVNQAKAEALKTVAKTKAKQEEGAKVGTSSKTNNQEQEGVDYSTIRNKDWSEL